MRSPATRAFLMFQLGDEVDHPARNGRLASDAAAKGAVGAASALRKAEQAALEGSGLYLTPTLVVASFDAELVGAGAPAGGELAETAYTQAYAALEGTLAPWPPRPTSTGSASPGTPAVSAPAGVERLGPLGCARSPATSPASSCCW